MCPLESSYLKTYTQPSECFSYLVWKRSYKYFRFPVAILHLQPLGVVAQCCGCVHWNPRTRKHISSRRNVAAILSGSGVTTTSGIWSPYWMVDIGVVAQCCRCVHWNPRTRKRIPSRRNFSAVLPVSRVVTTSGWWSPYWMAGIGRCRTMLPMCRMESPYPKTYT